MVGGILLAYIIQGKATEATGKDFEVPRDFTYMAPYIMTLIVLAFASTRLRPPAWAGKPWRKGQSE